MISSHRIIALSLTSRVVTISIAILSDFFLCDHKATDVTEFKISLGTCWLTFIKWDAAHFLNIAKYGYQHEFEFVFFPLFPTMIGNIARYASQQTLISFEKCLILSGVIISNVSFILSAIILMKIVERLPISRNHKLCTLLCFCFSPANIFFSTIYSESVYMLLLWSGIFFLQNINDDDMPSITNIFLGSLFLCLACFTRSNSIVGFVFLLFNICDTFSRDYRNEIKKRKPKFWRNFIRLIFKYLILGILSIITVWYPSYSINSSAMNFICSTQYTLNHNSDEKILYNDTICSPNHISWSNFEIYSKLQQKYWNAGFLRFYQVKQIPNFLLAIPIVVISMHTISCGKLYLPPNYYKSSKYYFVKIIKFCNLEKYSKFSSQMLIDILDRILIDPFSLHMIILLFVGLLFAHVQILTRLICSSCPLIYVGMADIFIRGGYFRKRLLIAYLLVYYIGGTILHVNFYPWT